MMALGTKILLDPLGYSNLIFFSPRGQMEASQPQTSRIIHGSNLWQKVVATMLGIWYQNLGTTRNMEPECWLYQEYETRILAIVEAPTVLHYRLSIDAQPSLTKRLD